MLDILSKFERLIIPGYLRGYLPTLIKWLGAGYLLRLFFMPILVQSDLVNNGFQAMTLLTQGYWLPTIYSPLYFYIYAGWLKLFQPVMPYGIYWDIPCQINFGTDPNQWVTSLLLRLSDPNTYFFLFISKALFLIPDFIAAIAILRLFDKPSEGLFAFKFWIMNPISIFVTYIVGQFDIFAVAFLMLSLVAFYKKRYICSIICLGLGAAFKIYLLALVPLVLLPLAHQKPLTLKFKDLAKGVVLSVLPPASSYLSVTFIPVRTAGYNLKIYTPTFSIFELFLNRTITFTTNSGFNDYFFVYVFFYFCFVFLYYLRSEYSYDSFWRHALCIFLFYFALSFFHLQWFLWPQPLIVIAIVKYRRLLPVYLAALIGFAGYLLYLDPALTTYLLLPLNSNVISWPTITQLMTNVGLPVSMVIGIFRTLLSAGCFGMAVFVLWKSCSQKTSAAVNNSISELSEQDNKKELTSQEKNQKEETLRDIIE